MYMHTTACVYMYVSIHMLHPATLMSIMEYGSTPYIGMALKKMVAALHVYKVIC